jgi:hypothetical protein
MTSSSAKIAVGRDHSIDTPAEFVVPATASESHDSHDSHTTHIVLLPNKTLLRFKAASGGATRLVSVSSGPVDRVHDTARGLAGRARSAGQQQPTVHRARRCKDPRREARQPYTCLAETTVDACRPARRQVCGIGRRPEQLLRTQARPLC